MEVRKSAVSASKCTKNPFGGQALPGPAPQTPSLIYGEGRRGCLKVLYNS